MSMAGIPTLPECVLKGFKPVDDSYFCKLVAKGEKVGSIIIPDQSKEEMFIAQVVRRGSGRLHIYPTDEGEPVFSPMTHEEGAFVVFPLFQGQRIMFGSDVFILLRQDDIRGTIDPDVMTEAFENGAVEWMRHGKHDGQINALDRSQVIEGAGVRIG